jgi:hypothetical protein
MHPPAVASVALAGMLETQAWPGGHRDDALPFLAAFEAVSSQPARFLTGYCVAAKALRR